MPFRKYRNYVIENMAVGYILIHRQGDCRTDQCVVKELNTKAKEYLGIEIQQTALNDWMIHATNHKKPSDWVSAVEHICYRATIDEVNFEMEFNDKVYCVTSYQSDEFIIATLTDITERHMLQEELKRKNEALTIKNTQLYTKTITDDLTQLYSRDFMFAIIEKAIERTRRNATALTLCVIDIDNFKSVNDKYGHLVGDKVLRKLSDLMAQNLRASDFIGRYGGEEFILVLQETSIEAAFEICERMRLQIESKKFKFKSDMFTVTISTGIALYKSHSLEDFISVADLKMYEAKRKGKNMIVY